ncbi:hypothetical protein ACFR9U_12610 [Halorientalis brevis]|uniref:Uncharacterized protein n=1 Tax=Halorientalis brevis TaxID=1126241 RepID=A0ABD6CCR7_9EURY|nr:hypothetical protein [Halorientalis brevis]
MPPSLRDDLSLPFLVLGSALAGVLAVGYLQYPEMFSIDSELALAYGGLLIAFSLAYSYRPLRESRYGALVSALFLMLFARLLYVQGIRGPLMPFGLFSVALAAFCYELYKLGSERIRRGQASR